MKRLTILMLILLTLTNCRSRKKIIDVKKSNEKTTIKVDSSSNVSRETLIEKSVKEDKKKETIEDRNNGEIIIKGNTDSQNPLEYFNVQNGDTISSIRIHGSAAFSIQNKWQKTFEKVSEVNNTNTINKVSEIVRKSVSKSTIKEAAKIITNKNVNVKEKGFNFAIYLIIGVSILFIIAIYFLFPNSIKSLLNKIFIKNDK